MYNDQRTCSYVYNYCNNAIHSVCSVHDTLATVPLVSCIVLFFHLLLSSLSVCQGVQTLLLLSALSLSPPTTAKRLHISGGKLYNTFTESEILCDLTRSQHIFLFFGGGGGGGGGV